MIAVLKVKVIVKVQTKAMVNCIVLILELFSVPQEFALHEKPKEDRTLDVGGTDEEDGDATARSEQQAWGQKDRGQDDKDKQKKQGQQKKKLEPSLKWKALGMEEYKELIFVLFIIWLGACIHIFL